MTISLIVPKGKAKGCLIRSSKVGGVSPIAEERIEQLDPRDWQPFIDANVDLHDHSTWIFDQGNIGSCGTESVSKGVMLTEHVSEGECKLLNPWGMYYFTSGGKDQGSAIDDNLQHARKYGIPSDDVWPRYRTTDGGVINPWNRKPSDVAVDDALRHRIDEFYDVTTIRGVGSCLCGPFAVVFGWQGHSCVLTKLLSQTKAEYDNSWAPSWGNKGRGVIALAEIDFRYGCFAIRTTIHNG